MSLRSDSSPWKTTTRHGNERNKCRFPSCHPGMLLSASRSSFSSTSRRRTFLRARFSRGSSTMVLSFLRDACESFQCVEFAQARAENSTSGKSVPSECNFAKQKVKKDGGESQGLRHPNSVLRLGMRPTRVGNSLRFQADLKTTATFGAQQETRNSGGRII